MRQYKRPTRRTHPIAAIIAGAVRVQHPFRMRHPEQHVNRKAPQTSHDTRVVARWWWIFVRFHGGRPSLKDDLISKPSSVPSITLKRGRNRINGGKKSKTHRSNRPLQKKKPENKTDELGNAGFGHQARNVAVGVIIRRGKNATLTDESLLSNSFRHFVFFFLRRDNSSTNNYHTPDSKKKNSPCVSAATWATKVRRKNETTHEGSKGRKIGKNGALRLSLEGR